MTLNKMDIITDAQLKKWIALYMQSVSAYNVMHRSWTGQLVHKLRRESYAGYVENASRRWERAIANKIADLKQCKSFDELWQEVGKIQVVGIGELSKYDTATCIGCECNLYPQYVYLHAGATEGAAAIGVKGKKVLKEVFVARFAAFEALEPTQIEDFLCIYKSCLRGDMKDCERVCRKRTLQTQTSDRCHQKHSRQSC